MVYKSFVSCHLSLIEVQFYSRGHHLDAEEQHGENKMPLWAEKVYPCWKIEFQLESFIKASVAPGSRSGQKEWHVQL